MRSLTSFLLSTSILALPACGGDPVEPATTSGSTGGTSTGPVTDSTTNPTAASTTGVEDTTTAGTGTSESSPTTNPTTGAPETTSTSSTGESGTTTTPVDTTTDGTTTDGTTTGGTTTTAGTTGGPGLCVGLPAMECMANDACMPLGGGKLNLQKMCVSKPMFLGCVDAGVCGGALTYACDSAVNPPEPYLFPSTCLPDGWEPCEAPPIEMPCK